MGADYPYALEVICEYLGQRVELSSFCETRWTFIEQVALLNEAFKTTVPFEFVISDSRYQTLFLSRSRIKEMVSETTVQQLEHVNGTVRAARHELMEFLESVNLEGLDVVGFYG